MSRTAISYGMVTAMTRLWSLLIGYAFGNLLFAMIIGKLLLHKDPTKYGSHNPGTANVGAVFGKKFGILTCLGDLAKTLICLFIIRALFPGQVNLAYAGLGLILGHCFPIWMKGQGGKGVAVAAQLLVFYDWRAGFICLLIGLLLVILMKNLTVPPLSFVLIFSVYELVKEPVESGIVLLACLCVMIYKFRRDLVDFLQGRGKRVDVLYSIKKKMGVLK